MKKNATPGKKLRITGGGRCNVTNNKPDVRVMLDQYKGQGKFFFSTFTQHGVQETINWFHDRGVHLKEENEGRLFPTTDRADTIYHALRNALTETGVTIIGNCPVVEVSHNISDQQSHFTITTNTGHTYIGINCIIATGGTARPDTGSTGDGFAFAAALGHTINPASTALVPLHTTETWVQTVSGVTLPNVKLTVNVDGQRQLTKTGKLLFTHTGLSGPTILNMSKQIGELLDTGTVTITINPLPQHDQASLQLILTDLFATHSNKLLKNVLPELLPAALVKQLLAQVQIDGDTPCHSVRSADRKQLAIALQTITLTIDSLLGVEKAIATAGGVKLEEIDFKTMQSRLVPRLFIIGDMLDIDRPSGGYSLQLCWSTGFVAGTHAALKMVD